MCCFCFHTDRQSPPQPPPPLQLTGDKHLVFSCRHFYHFYVTFATLPHCRNLWVVIIVFHVPLAISRRFCFHTDLRPPPQPPAPLQPTGGKNLLLVL
jgi:hypothetical protein